MYKCINCVWSGNNVIGPYNHCPVCGDNTKGTLDAQKPTKKELSLDLNKDGKVDKKDVSIAAKVMRKVRSPRKSRKVNKK